MPFKKIPPLYNVWQGMLNRCRQPNNPQWRDYGGRGIAVCNRWQNSFSNFVADMGPRPDGYTLDRIDNNGNYTPKNCKWSSRKEQQRNRRITLRITRDGSTYTIAELAEKSGLKFDTVAKRAAQGLTLPEIVAKERRYDLSGLALGGVKNGQRQRQKTHCKSGHPFNEANTHHYVAASGAPARSCKRCHAIREAERRKSRKTA